MQSFICFCKDWTDLHVREGQLEKLWGGWGIFEPQEFFFVINFLA